MSWISPRFELSGFCFEVEVSDDDQREAVLSDIAGYLPHDGSPDIRVSWQSEPLDLDGVELAGDEGKRQLGQHPEGLAIRHRGVNGLANGDSITIGGTSSDPEALLDDYQTVFSAALTRWLAGRKHFPVHAAAIARGDDALLLLGHPGVGKSTAAWGAHRAGFDHIGDDIVFFRNTTGRPEISGLRKPVGIPSEVLDEIPEDASQATFGDGTGGTRDRWGLNPDLMTSGWHRVIGIVLPGHGDNPEGELVAAEQSAVLPLLAAKYFAADDEDQLRSWFPQAAAASRLPAWELRHTPDVDRRLEVAAHWLGVAFDRALAASDADGAVREG